MGPGGPGWVFTGWVFAGVYAKRVIHIIRTFFARKLPSVAPRIQLPRNSS